MKIFFWITTSCLALIYFLLTVRDLRSDDLPARERLKRNFPAAHILKEREKAFQKAKAITLDTFMPSFDGLVQFLYQPDTFDKSDFSEYLLYYQRVVEYFPSLPEAYGMMGLCHYYLGKLVEAKDDFRKGLSFDPHLFWLNYNLGVVEFNDGHYAEAAGFFFKAISVSPTETMKNTMGSKVYQQIFAGSHLTGQDLAGRIRQVYGDAFRWLALSFYHLESYPNMLKVSLQAIERQVGGQDFYFYAGVAAFELKEYAQAADYFKKVIEQGGNPQAYQYLGRILKAQRKDLEATDVLRKFDALEKTQSVTGLFLPNSSDTDLRSSGESPVLTTTNAFDREKVNKDFSDLHPGLKIF